MCQQTFTLKTHFGGLSAGSMHGILLHASSHIYTVPRPQQLRDRPLHFQPHKTFQTIRELILVNRRDRLAICTDVATIHAGRIKWHRDIAVLINGDDPALAPELN